MTTLLEQPPAARRRGSLTTHLRRAGAVLLATALGLGGLSLPALASTATAGEGATATGPDSVIVGQSLHIEGDGWVSPAAAGGGSVIGVKLDDSTLAPPTAVTNPVSGAPFNGVWAIVQAEADGSWQADLPFPTADNTNPAGGYTAAAWAAGTTHNVRLLTGSLKPGDQPRSVSLPFTVVEAPAAAKLTATAANGGRGAAAAQVTLTLAGQSFTPGATTTVTVDDEPATWSTAPTIAADGTFSGGRVVFAPGALRTGTHKVSVSDGTKTATAEVKTNPVLTWTGLTAGVEGTLTLANLPTGATVRGLELGDVDFAVASATAADAAGTATVSYSIPDDAKLGTLTLTITQGNPTAEYTASVKISPSSETFGEDGYTVVTAPDPIQQGLYQTDYSARADAVFATSANVTTTSTIYKLDPDTLAVQKSVVPAFVNGMDGALWAAYGIGVDDTNGTVWVSQTRQNTVAVYSQDDLSLIRQFPAGTTTHSRDVVYDPASDQVFVSSASEGSSGDGYISVFNAKTLEKVKDVQTGARTVFSPVSLALDESTDTLYSVSLTTSRLGVLDTKSLNFTTLDLPGLPSGSKASGVAIDEKTNRVYVASQNADSLLIADAATGATVAQVATGAGALNVAFDPVNRLVYVANFGGTTISVADADGTLVANLRFARPNHVEEDGKGSVFAVNKDTGNTVIKITPKPAAQTPVEGSTPTISGAAAVGGTLTAAPGNWTQGATLAYQWSRAGAPIDGATATTYTPVAADLGKSLTVTATGTLAGRTATSKTSAAVTVTVGTLKSTSPKLSGSVKVGSRVTAVPGAWTSGTRFSYQWKRSGSSIKGATGSTYTPTSSDRGTTLSVSVTGSLAGHTSVTKASAGSKVGYGTLTSSTPKISGTVKVGKKLSVVRGTWTSGTSFSYQWYANGKAIKGKKSSTLTLGTSQRGKKITVKVTGKKSGYTTVAKTSKATKKVA